MPNTGNIAASFYLGLANYQQPVAKGNYYTRGHEDAGYIQDNFKVTHRLTLNLGVRWQFTPYAKPKDDVFSSFDLKTMSIVLGTPLSRMYALGATTPSLVNALTAAGANLCCRRMSAHALHVNTNWHDIGPHVSFAYRALSDPSPSSCGGYATTFFLVDPWLGCACASTPLSPGHTELFADVVGFRRTASPNYGLSIPRAQPKLNSANALNLNVLESPSRSIPSRKPTSIRTSPLPGFMSGI